MAIVAFDIVGTLFSLGAPRRALIEGGAPKTTLELWFAQALRDYFALSHSGNYVPLKEVLEASLPRALSAVGVEPEADLTERVLITLERLEPAEGAHEACKTLVDAGFELLAVTNSSRESTLSLLEQSELAEQFDAVVSCDSLGTSKPHPKVYDHIRQRGEPPMWMIAAHGWDISGAAYAGLKTAWISKVEGMYLDVHPTPDIEADSLDDAARQMTE